jgi:hypothetical protein
MGTEKEIVSTRVHPDLHEAIEEEAISRSNPATGSLSPSWFESSGREV